MRVTLQPFTPFDRCLLWRFHDAYFGARGGEAWKKAEVPSFSTSNYATACQHARLLAGVVTDAERRGARPAGAPVWVLEIGGGGGLFATNFLRALEHGAGAAGADVFRRVRFVFSDYSETVLRDAEALPALAAHAAAGRFITTRYDLRRPASLVVPGWSEAADAPAAPPLAMVVGNYVTCVLPLKNLQFCRGTWYEQWVRTELDGVSEADAALGAEALLERVAAAPTKEGLVQRELRFDYKWREIPLGDVFAGGVHQDVLTAVAREHPEATVAYPYGYLDLIAGGAPFLEPTGFFLANDFGSVRREDLVGLGDRRPRIYGNSIANPIDFAVFDTFGAVTGWQIVRTRDPLGALFSAALRPAAPWVESERAVFAAAYVASRDGDDLLDHATTARQAMERREYERALRYWRRCIALDPESAEYRHRAGVAAIEADQLGIAQAELTAGLARRAASEGALDFEYQLGRVDELGELMGEAERWYERAVGWGGRGGHAAAWTALGRIYQAQERFEDAYRCYAQGLALDPANEKIKARIEELRDHWWWKAVATPS